MANIIDELDQANLKAKPLPEFRVGDTVDVHVRIKEGEKERIQVFSGTVIKIQGGHGLRATFTVRRIVASEGVERTFPFHSPVVTDVKVTRKGKVRRARLFYLRDRVGKATRVKERRDEGPRKRKSRKARQEAREAAKAAREAAAKEAEAAAEAAAEAKEPAEV